MGHRLRLIRELMRKSGGEGHDKGLDVAILDPVC